MGIVHRIQAERNTVAKKYLFCRAEVLHVNVIHNFPLIPQKWWFSNMHSEHVLLEMSPGSRFRFGLALSGLCLHQQVHVPELGLEISPHPSSLLGG